MNWFYCYLIIVINRVERSDVTCIYAAETASVYPSNRGRRRWHHRQWRHRRRHGVAMTTPTTTSTCRTTWQLLATCRTTHINRWCPMNCIAGAAGAATLWMWWNQAYTAAEHGATVWTSLLLLLMMMIMMEADAMKSQGLSPYDRG